MKPDPKTQVTLNIRGFRKATMMNQTIINAINNMEILSFTYKGNPRIVEPHAYGMGSDGNDLLIEIRGSGLAI